MAQDSLTGEGKTRPKRRRAARKAPTNVLREASVEGGIAASRVSAGGTIYVGVEHAPDPRKWQQAVYDPPALDHYRPVDKLVFTTSLTTPIACAGMDELVGGGGADELYVGDRLDVFQVHGPVPTNAELEQEAGELLKAARNAEADPSIRSVRRRFEEAVFSDAVATLGGAQTIGMAIRDEADLLRAIGLGFPASVLNSLRQAGFRNGDLEGVIAPRRTLARRKAGDQRLTRVESDAAWRIAHLLSLGARVLRGPEAAVAWLRRPKAALGDQTPIDLVETAVGAQAVERLLFHLEWGDVA